MNLGNWRVVPDGAGHALYMLGGPLQPDGGFPRWAALFADSDGVCLVLHVRGGSTTARDVEPEDMNHAVGRAYALLDGAT